MKKQEMINKMYKAGLISNRVKHGMETYFTYDEVRQTYDIYSHTELGKAWLRRVS